MRKSNQQLKRELFDIYTKNFDFVNKNNGSLSFIPYTVDTYPCPICFNEFSINDLLPKSSYLTLEHIPPESLGGKGSILTCNKCNSDGGRLLDSELLKYLESIDFEEMLPNSKNKARMSFDGHVLNILMTVDKNGHVNMNFDPERNNPKTFNAVIQLINEKSNDEIEFQKPVSGSMPRKEVKYKLLQVALLRIAYLQIFSTFGFSSLLNHGMLYVREQILNPEKDILDTPYNITLSMSDKLDGINIIKYPTNLQSFLAVFNLRTKSLSRKFMVMLPGPSGPMINIYKNFKETVLNTHHVENLDMQIEHLPFQKYVSNLRLSFDYHRYWQSLTKNP